MSHTANHSSSPFEDHAFASLFQKIRAPVAQRVAKEVVRLAEIKSGDTLLDLGCGPGLVSKEIMEQVNLKFALLVDSSIEMVNLAEKNLRGKKVKNFEVKQTNVMDSSLASPTLSQKKLLLFDRVIAIDLWHLLPERAKLIQSLSKLISPEGNLTIALHKQTSKKNMHEWHNLRQGIRDEIERTLQKGEYPKFEFKARSRGPTVHTDEISTFLTELSKSGFILSKKFEDSELADVNQLIHHLPESFIIETRRVLPGAPESFVKRIVNSAVRNALKAQGKENLTEKKDFRISTESFFVFKKK